MAYKVKYGQGTEGRRIVTIAGAGANPLLGFQQTDAASGPCMIDETETISIMLLAGGTLAGGATAWKIEASNNFSPGQFGQVPNVGDWVDVTARFTPAVVAVVDGVSGEKQMIEPTLGACGWRAIRFTFTASGGAGDAEAWVTGKGA